MSEVHVLDKAVFQGHIHGLSCTIHTCTSIYSFFLCRSIQSSGPCITNVFATRRKNFSQWHRSFQRKLRSHWLKFLRHVAIMLVIQGPDVPLTATMIPAAFVSNSELHQHLGWLFVLWSCRSKDDLLGYLAAITVRFNIVHCICHSPTTRFKTFFSGRITVCMY